MQVAWRKYVCLLEDQHSEITFSGLVDFIDKQVKIAKHPVFSQEALCEADLKVKHVTASSKNRSVSSVYATNVGSDGDFKQQQWQEMLLNVAITEESSCWKLH